ncbi:MAG TPA: M23 family metallopeptidase [Arenimonas sp.]|nr:M23 family metallopeptidase [Arenimonas sp.]
MKKLFLLALVAGLTACAGNKETRPFPPPASIELPDNAIQGDMVMGRVPSGAIVMMNDENPAPDAVNTELKVADNGRIVFGIGRDETRAKILDIRLGNGESIRKKINITTRQFDIENINGVPENTVNPPPDIAARIEREQAEVVSARLRNDNRRDFDTAFIWPLEGRVSGVYGSQRIYNGTPKSWHSGLDVAAAQGTPVKAPAAGIITFAKPDLYLTGGTILIDHGMGISSNFLHLSRLDVKVGDRVEQGQVIGLVGATGRATGPHMHWGMNWLKVRIDPQLLLPAKP